MQMTCSDVASSTGTSVLRITNQGNVGIGTTTPVAKLSLQGTAGANDMFDVASSTGTSVLRITNQGNVGIGTTGPSAKLHVSSGAFGGTLPTEPNFIVEDSNNSIISILSPNTAGGYIQFEDPESATVGQLAYLHTDNSMRFNTNGNERVIITNTGNVGIGTTGPTSVFGGSRTVLEVAGNGASYLPEFVMRAGSNYTQRDWAFSLGNPTSWDTDLRLNLGSSNLLTIKNSGNVGIGTTGPGYKLHVSGDIKTNDLYGGSAFAIANPTVGSNGFIRFMPQNVEKK